MAVSPLLYELRLVGEALGAGVGDAGAEAGEDFPSPAYESAAEGLELRGSARERLFFLLTDESVPET